MDSIKEIPLELIDDHPDNPRLFLRQDVVDGIAAQLQETGYFDPANALLVRPLNGRYQVVRGHQRKASAIKAGLESIPCWVREMSDDEAYMELALGNVQGELTPLEIGVHALKIDGRQGREGGLAEYARQIGKTRQTISSNRMAAEVLLDIKSQVDLTYYVNRAESLAAIYKTHRSLWLLLAKAIKKQGWSATDTQYWVDQVCDFNIAQKWQGVFLPLVDVIKRFLETKEFSPQTVTKLVKLAEAIEVLIDEYGIDTKKHWDEFIAWLSKNKGGKSWDPRQLTKYQRELAKRLQEEEFRLKSVWLLGDWGDHIDALKDESVSLLLTDPPYGIEYQSDYKLDRREERKHETIHGDNEKAKEELADMLKAISPKLAENAHILCFTHWQTEFETRAALEEAGYTIRGSLVWVKNNTGMGDPNTTFAPRHERIIHAVKGSPILFERQDDVLNYDRESSELHPTQKPIPLLKRLVEITTVEGELVIDPFGGTASTLVAARELNRVYWGCEIRQDYYESGFRRLAL